jgi:hypothetical protein
MIPRLGIQVQVKNNSAITTGRHKSFLPIIFPNIHRNLKKFPRLRLNTTTLSFTVDSLLLCGVSIRDQVDMKAK